MSWEQAELVRLLKGQPGTQYQEGTEKERDLIREWVRDLLKASIVEVEFVKADGQIRKMKCTLNVEYIPFQSLPKQSVISGITAGSIDGIKRKKPLVEDLDKPKEETTIRAYDVEAGGWRSFRYDRLRNIAVNIGFE